MCDCSCTERRRRQWPLLDFANLPNQKGSFLWTSLNWDKTIQNGARQRRTLSYLQVSQPLSLTPIWHCFNLHRLFLGVFLPLQPPKLSTQSSKESAQCAGPSPQQPGTTKPAAGFASSPARRRGRLCSKATTPTPWAGQLSLPACRLAYDSSACHANVAQIAGRRSNPCRGLIVLHFLTPVKLFEENVMFNTVFLRLFE